MPTPPSLDQQVRSVLAIDPTAPAVEFERQWVSWGQIGALADATEAALDAAGLPEGAAIGMLLANRPEMIGALLGVLASGRCIVTINPHQGAARLAADLQALRVPVLIACQAEWESSEALRREARATGALGLSAAPLAPGGAARLTPVEGCERVGPGEHHAPLPGVAVQMLTSGTTGAPKRVELHRSALERSLIGARHYEKADGAPAKPRLREGIAIINAPLVHVGGLWRTLQCVADGRSFALLEKFRVDPWLDCVVRHEPKTVSLVPAALRMVLEADLAPDALSSIRAVVSGTAPLPPEDAEAFEAKYGIPVLTSYGATEFAGGVAGWNLADHKKLREEKRGSVGRAHPGCELRIADADTGAALPAGREGLLEVRSSQLGPDSDWVRTTDRARMDDDGFLWITGRADSAILRGGFKVHPDEVQAALESHPAVHEASVVGLPDERLGAVPVAAVVLEADAKAIDEAALKAHAAHHLTRYQVPARIRIVDALPRTPSLKVSQPEVRALFETE